jgi:hypothetical protein
MTDAAGWMVWSCIAFVAWAWSAAGDLFKDDRE